MAEAVRSDEVIQRGRVRLVLVVGLLVLSASAFYALVDYDPDAGIRNAVEGVEGWLFHPTGRSPGLIFGVAALLFFGRRWLFIAAVEHSRPSVVLGLAFSIPGAALHSWGHYVGGPDILVLSLILLIFAAAAFVGGPGAMRVILLPALFLLLAIPPPAVLINQIVYPLQLLTAESATFFLNLIGLDALQNGDRILRPGVEFLVIEGCSGLRSAETLLMATIVYIEVFRCRGPRLWILLLSAPLVSYLVNQVRVISIVLNPFSRVSEVHTIQGIIVLVGGVIVIAGLDRLLVRWLGEYGRARSNWADWRGASFSSLPLRPLYLLLGIAAALFMASLLVPVWQPDARTGRTLSDVPMVIHGWVSSPVEVDTQFLGSVDFTERTRRRYRAPEGEGSFELFVGIDEHMQRNFSLISDKTQSLDAGWVVLSRREVVLEPDRQRAELMVVGSMRDRRLVLHWYEGVAAIGQEVIRSLLALDRGPLRRDRRSTVVRISTRIEEDADLSQAEDLIFGFLPSIREAIGALEENRWNRDLRDKLAAPRTDLAALGRDPSGQLDPL
jgi:exosortase